MSIPIIISLDLEVARDHERAPQAWILDRLRIDAKRLGILLSKTREEGAEKYVTKVEVHSDINRVLDRLDRLENKLDTFMREQRSALG